MNNIRVVQKSKPRPGKLVVSVNCVCNKKASNIINKTVLTTLNFIVWFCAEVGTQVCQIRWNNANGNNANGHYTVQDHSRSQILVPIESPYCLRLPNRGF